MLITFGDSFTYGFNFNERERVESVWPTILGKKLNQEVINTALPGSSNWRIARKLQNMPLTHNDVVVISWTEPTRFELGVSDNHYVPPIKENRIGDLVEYDDGMITKRFFHQLTDRTTDTDAKKLNELVYREFNNTIWFGEMFKVMYNSVLQILETSGCRWLMFNAWCVQSPGVYHENYIHQETTLSSILGTNDYWTKEQHKKVANIIMENLCIGE